MEIIDSNIQILKTRDDFKPVFLNKIISSREGEIEYQLCNGSLCSWLKNAETCRTDKIRHRIEPWLTALFQSEHFSLLLGSGLTQAVHQIATGEGLPGMNTVPFSVFKTEIDNAARKSAIEAGRYNANIEDIIRTANILLRGLEYYCPPESTSPKSGKLKENIQKLEADIRDVVENFASAILMGETKVATAERIKREQSFNYLVNFLMSFASRSGTRDRLHIFTTNYDRFIEVGAEVAGLHLLDRFIGSLCPIFRSSRMDIDMHYNPPGMRGEPRYLEGVAKFTKLHGSLDWVYAGKDIRRMGLPFGADSILPYLNAPGLERADPMQLMIYPNSAKDRETAAYPYVELFRDFAASICRPNSTVVTYGYSFGDEHINRVIEDMLTIPSTHLVIISYNDPLGRIIKTYEKMAKPSQISLLIGSHLGDLQTLVDHFLPKSAIDRTTLRMSELLKSRWGSEELDIQSRKDMVEENNYGSDPL